MSLTTPLNRFTTFSRLLSVAALTLSAAAWAQAEGNPDKCQEQAQEKKLAGAAKNSFLKKCQSLQTPAAEATCQAQAVEKKLFGAARNSFVKKCVADAQGPSASQAQ